MGSNQEIGGYCAVLLLTLAIFGVSVYGNFYLRHEFDPMMFLPQDSYLMRFVDTRAE